MPDPGLDFRKIRTHRGDYIVSWDPRHVDYLFRSENLSPDDLSLRDAGQAKRLIRDLFLLGARGDAGALADARDSLISGFARQLLGIYSHQAISEGA